MLKLDQKHSKMQHKEVSLVNVITWNYMMETSAIHEEVTYTI